MKQKIFKILNYLLITLFVLFFITFLFSKSLLSSFFVLLILLLLIPKTYNLIKSKLKNKINFNIKVVSILVLFILSLVCINDVNSDVDNSNKIFDNVLSGELLEKNNNSDNKNDANVNLEKDDLNYFDNKDNNSEGKDNGSIENEEKNLENVELYKVASVVDGDTIKVYINDVLESIRMIGLDTPETVDPRKDVQCFGIEASNKAKEMLSSKNVILEKDGSQGERDKYGRLLLYVYLEDGTLFNKWMIENGYGHEYTYNIPYKYQTEFQNAEKYARENKLGLWADDACNNINVSENINNNSQPSVDSQQAPVNENIQTLDGPQVKKSSTGICHEKGTTYYEKTKNFTSYKSVEDCLNSGGRLPKS